jgi:hypothetical protein
VIISELLIPILNIRREPKWPYRNLGQNGGLFFRNVIRKEKVEKRKRNVVKTG